MDEYSNSGVAEQLGQVWKPLSGLRVADFSGLFPGPFATTMLADLGADVVKFEPPLGDPARGMLPELFAATGRNKRSVELNLKTEEGKARLPDIAAWAEVVIEGFRPGVASRLGIGFEQIKLLNPGIVYCSLSGYGQSGPWKDRPGHDLNYLAAGGALAFSGMFGRSPGRSSLPLGDIAGGALAATAVLAALQERGRSKQAVYLDLSILEATLYCSSLRHGTEPVPAPDLFPGNDMFETLEGRHVTLALVEDHFWQAFRSLLGHELPELLSSRFDTLHSRQAHGALLAPLLIKLMKSRTVEQWRELFAGTDVPFEVCVTPAEALASEQIQARGRAVQLRGQSFVPFPVTVNGLAQPTVHSKAPDLGQHTQAYWTELSTSVDVSRQDSIGEIDSPFHAAMSSP